MRRYSGKKDPARRRDVERDGELRTYAENPSGLVEPVTLGPVRRYRKTSETFAVRMDAEYEVDTLEGRHTGKAGSYLAIGAQGELYPIDAEIFEETYELVEEGA